MTMPSMSHTTAEAGELWCPMVRVVVPPHHGDAIACNNPNTQFSGNCIADRCAMWRWGEFTSEVEEAVVSAPDLGAGGKRITTKLVKKPVRGYCGLAGRPVLS